MKGYGGKHLAFSRGELMVSVDMENFFQSVCSFFGRMSHKKAHATCALHIAIASRCPKVKTTIGGLFYELKIFSSMSSPSIQRTPTARSFS